MKRNTLLALTLFVGFFSLNASAQEKKKASPPASVKETTSSGVTIAIDYSQPSVKGRTIGGEIAPYGKVWRTGANEATTFEVSKAVKVEGKNLPAGKYGLYTIPGEKEWTIIFNKTWKQWGTNYAEADDALRVTVKPEKSSAFTEQMTFKIDKSGKVTLLWGDKSVSFRVK
ncbi:DUF2911 domain-containing protein [Pedobacter gandavensis]|uniref:DUF2911 domain-containing protein n=1 Tax=Pedobacter TaxID=84567 RepID=UPI001C991562|nr:MULTISPECIES: DUF2911 domain-containing protein [Pedobacter]WGQ12557.1 DUF2911 domain-containing protein [Pedobacter gandavensis]